MNLPRLPRSLVIAAVLSTTAVVACSSSDDDASSSLTATGPLVRGRVTAAGGAPVAGVTVSAGSVTATTDASGLYSLKAPAGSAVIRFAKTGYTEGHERITVGAKFSTQLDALLLAAAPPTPIDAAAGGTVPSTRGSSVVVPPNALVDATGAPVTGTVQVSLTPIDPSNGDELTAAPGDFQAAQAGQPTMLESYGMVEITIRRGEEKLQVANGQTIELHIPKPAGMATPEPTIPLWSYNETTGIWDEEGTATWDATTSTYVAKAPHMSTWNCDKPYLATCICGTVYEKGKGILPGARIQGNGVSYYGTSEASADDNGKFCIAVQKDSEVDILAYHKSGGGQSRRLRSTSESTTVPPTMGDSRCLDGGRWEVERDVIETSDGAKTSCTAATAYDDTCASDLGMALGGCFDPSGACTLKIGDASGAVISYANGAKLTAGDDGAAKFYASNGTLCMTVTADGERGGTYTLPSGAKYTYESREDGSTTLTCPNGQTTTVTAQQQQAIQACTPSTTGTSSTGQQCTIEGSGTEGMPCGAGDTCASGLVCCTIQTSKACLQKSTCDQVQQSGN